MSGGTLINRSDWRSVRVREDPRGNEPRTKTGRRQGARLSQRNRGERYLGGRGDESGRARGAAIDAGTLVPGILVLPGHGSMMLMRAMFSPTRRLNECPMHGAGMHETRLANGEREPEREKENELFHRRSISPSDPVRVTPSTCRCRGKRSPGRPGGKRARVRLPGHRSADSA